MEADHAEEIGTWHLLIPFETLFGVVKINKIKGQKFLIPHNNIYSTIIFATIVCNNKSSAGIVQNSNKAYFQIRVFRTEYGYNSIQTGFHFEPTEHWKQKISSQLLCTPSLKSLRTQKQRSFWFVKSVGFLDELSYFLIFNSVGSVEIMIYEGKLIRFNDVIYFIPYINNRQDQIFSSALHHETLRTSVHILSQFAWNKYAIRGRKSVLWRGRNDRSIRMREVLVFMHMHIYEYTCTQKGTYMWPFALSCFGRSLKLLI